jgi:two-component system, sensor histidine kinase LadS
MEIRDLFKDISPAEFQLLFTDHDACLEFLAAHKWKDGFTCRKCGHTNYCDGKTPHARRCTRCKREESAGAHTFFHRCRIPLPDAFRMIYIICGEPGISTYNLAGQFGTRQMTCWKLKKKVMECLQEKGDIMNE